ncbi:probable pectinesterase 56 [Nicotiana sylvestris]|uniref:probable pectinesterase 56 n=1 Tax=Nicotiana sylvestris TaxID=4096 RepID=UPI00388CC8AA
MAAVSAAPNNSVTYYYIKIKQGTYNEYVQIESWKTNIVFIGEGMDKTIISGDKSYGAGIGTMYTATVGVNGQGFVAQGITFRNIAGPKMLQAVALRAEADFLTFYQCRFEGYQDTLYTKYGRQFYRDCDILGTIDFICGDAAAVFQNCLIEVRQPLLGQYITISAQQRDFETTLTGLVLQNCTLKATPDLEKAEVEPFLFSIFARESAFPDFPANDDRSDLQDLLMYDIVALLLPPMIKPSSNGNLPVYYPNGGTNGFPNVPSGITFHKNMLYRLI